MIPKNSPSCLELFRGGHQRRVWVACVPLLVSSGPSSKLHAAGVAGSCPERDELRHYGSPCCLETIEMLLMPPRS